VIICYTNDFRDYDDVARAGLALRRRFGPGMKLYYKTDVFTLAGNYAASGNTSAYLLQPGSDCPDVVREVLDESVRLALEGAGAGVSGVVGGGGGGGGGGNGAGGSSFGGAGNRLGGGGGVGGSGGGMGAVAAAATSGGSGHSGGGRGGNGGVSRRGGGDGSKHDYVVMAMVEEDATDATHAALLATCRNKCAVDFQAHCFQRNGRALHSYVL
jgi:hypothetical protein